MLRRCSSHGQSHSRARAGRDNLGFKHLRLLLVQLIQADKSPPRPLCRSLGACRLLTGTEVADGVLQLVSGGKTIDNGSAMRVYVHPKDGLAVHDMFQYPPKTFGGPP